MPASASLTSAQSVNFPGKKSSWDYRQPLILRQNSVIRTNLYCLRSNLKRRKSTSNSRQGEVINHAVELIDGLERALLSVGLIGQLKASPISHPAEARQSDEFIKAGYRTLAKKYLPDHGGMQQINAVVQKLRGACHD